MIFARTFPIVIGMIVTVQVFAVAAGRSPVPVTGPGWTHGYQTSREYVPLRLMPYKAFKFRPETIPDRAALRARIAVGPRVAAVLEGTEFMQDNGIVLMRPQGARSAGELRAGLSPGVMPQFAGDVFSPFPEADAHLDMQFMMTPFLFVSYVIPSGGGDIQHLLSAYGGTVKETLEFTATGIRGYLIEFPEDANLFELAELYALDPNVRAAAPEFLSLADPAATDECPFGENPSPEGCSCAGSLPANNCFGLAEMPGRPALAPDDPLYTPWAEGCFYRGYDWFFPRRGINLHLINAHKAWDITTGHPDVRVAVLDAGVGPCSDYLGMSDLPEGVGGVVLEGFDAVYGTNETYDLHAASHGTTVAGIIAARRNNGIGVAGIAGGDGDEHPGCTIVPVRATAATINGDVTNYPFRAATALTWIASGCDGEPCAEVVNMSMGCLSSSEALIAAVEQAHAAGVILIAAAHNQDLPVPGYPARYPEVIAAAGITFNPHLATHDLLDNPWTAEDVGLHRFFGIVTGDPANECVHFARAPTGSNHGSAIDLAGVSVLSATPVSAWESSAVAAFDDDEDVSTTTTYHGAERKWYEGYNLMGATSGATPHVAGVAALLMSRDRELQETQGYVPLDPIEAVAMLKASAKDIYYIRDGANPGPYMTTIGEDTFEIAGAGRDPFTGYGLVDAAAAVALVEEPRFIIKNRDGEVVASFFSDGITGETGDLDQAYGTIDYGRDGDSGARSVPDSVGGQLAGTAASGSLVLRGRLYESQDPGALAPAPAGDFIVRKSEGAQVAVARIDAAGNLYLAGRVHQYPWAPSNGSAFPDPASPPGEGVTACFTVRTTAGVPFAFFTSEGHLYLRGNLFETARPDPDDQHELVWYEDFEFEGSIQANADWSVTGDWTKDRFKQFAACLTAGGVRMDEEIVPDPCYSGPVDPVVLQHLAVSFAHVIVDEVDPNNRTAQIVIGSRSGRELLSAQLHRVDWDCANPVQLGSTPAPDFTISNYPVNGYDWIRLLLGGWYFEALDSESRLMGGNATGKWVLSPEGNVNVPNRFLTLNSIGGNDFVERAVDLADNDGFMIDIHYQIAENGTETQPEDNPGLIVELFEDGLATPVIRATVNHYSKQLQGDNDPTATYDRTRLWCEIDINRDGDAEDPGEQPNPSNPEFRYDYARWQTFAMFSPALRATAWYQIVLLVQRDIADGYFHVRAVNKLEGIQTIPADIRLSVDTQSQFRPTIMRLRIANPGAYQESTHLRIDDITVVQVQTYD